MIPRRTFSIVIGLSAVSLAIAQPAAADLIDLIPNDRIPGTDWRVRFPGNVRLQFLTDQTTNNSAGTLIETATQGTDPITITFEQTADTPTSSNSGGLRLNFRKTAVNTDAQGRPWLSYTLQLTDDVPAKDRFQNAVHPTQPHFHPTNTLIREVTPATFVFGSATYTGNEVNKYDGTFRAQAQHDPSDTLILKRADNRGVQVNRSLEIINLLIHERQFARADLPETGPGRRVFRLIETPTIPEPATLLLLGTALITLSFPRHRRN